MKPSTAPFQFGFVAACRSVIPRKMRATNPSTVGGVITSTLIGTVATLGEGYTEQAA
jgi:hypothetical protein